jgi:hypothetical protein
LESRLALNLRSSCLCLLSAGITHMHHHDDHSFNHSTADMAEPFLGLSLL